MRALAYLVAGRVGRGEVVDIKRVIQVRVHEDVSESLMVEQPGPFLVAEDIVDQNWQRRVLRADGGDGLEVKVADFRHVPCNNHA